MKGVPMSAKKVPNSRPTFTDEEKVKRITGEILKGYGIVTRGREALLTDFVRRAIVSDEMYHVMLARYEAESEKETHTNPNLYVEAAMAARKVLDL